MSKLNHQISLLELIQILSAYRQNIILNLHKLKEDYYRTGIKRVRGVRDINGDLITPWLQTEDVYAGDFVQMGVFAINRNTATINMLIRRKVKLVKSEDNTHIIEVAGLLAHDLDNFNNYTIVKDGKVHVSALNIKISNKKVFDLLQAKGVIIADKFDFNSEYIIQLDTLPLVPVNIKFASIDGLFTQLAEIKVVMSILSAYLRHQSDVFVSNQVEELKQHYLSKNLYLNFPKTQEYPDTIDSHISYKIEFGNQDILNLSKLYAANQFLARRYEVYDKETGEIFPKPTLEMGLNQNIAFRQKALSARMKLTKVDDLMKPIFDDFLGININGKVGEILNKVGDHRLALLLYAQHAGKSVNGEDLITAMTTAYQKLAAYVEQTYQENISPMVFYIGVTGLLPNKISAKAMTADELAAKYPHLQFSKHEQAGTFFEVGNTIISVYPQTEYYSKNSLAVS
ncbi:hypothetical protein [Dolichospermum flos-aquae]|jgi:hypothetical protein|uniref:Uncharacterized protein n=1 Tax=Dolichospermum flos-aquae CCAP 1403/13F TaxID=315271 RepID=A0A6H2C5D3_DOLFA|nr:hypothetical protein [Dolichospermum flos-aquae]QJB46653.1 hypothetical protein HGD76_23180 [Dolichospermum flos-aquae CCAP 1403/13F]